MAVASTQTILKEHAALSAVLTSMLMLMQEGPGDAPERFFDVMRAMLFYIDEFPERRHHPKESDLLFPKLARLRPDLMPVIRRLEDEHMAGEGRVRELQHLLLAWELLGETRHERVSAAAHAYVTFYREHMRTEETVLLPAAREALSPDDWRDLDAAFGRDIDPLAGGVQDPVYDRLFSRIVLSAPAPIGVGPALAARRSHA
ncbi:hemerythrin domain-containing protein [Ramlibacter terrae]|uniref:Hemerythrin domain-containing protein n=1 Tax=Ramlibacter terrae TaxID=2732511 RepID=A0ABX6P4K6_9BURK|nr:hemerythrin domain-containing protein [Ramlibacter terrae]